jgi:site-specific recombinase XerC
VNIAPTRVTFGAACDEWLDYIEHERKRRPSTVRDYRQTVKNMLLPEFEGEHADRGHHDDGHRRLPRRSREGRAPIR